MPDKNLPHLFQVTEVELIYRNPVARKDRPFVSGSPDAFELLLNSWDFNKIELVEQFRVLLLDQGNRCLGISDISSGIERVFKKTIKKAR